MQPKRNLRLLLSSGGEEQQQNYCSILFSLSWLTAIYLCRLLTDARTFTHKLYSHEWDNNNIWLLYGCERTLPLQLRIIRCIYAMTTLLGSSVVKIPVCLRVAFPVCSLGSLFPAVPLAGKVVGKTVVSNNMLQLSCNYLLATLLLCTSFTVFFKHRLSRKARDNDYDSMKPCWF